MNWATCKVLVGVLLMVGASSGAAGPSKTSTPNAASALERLLNTLVERGCYIPRSLVLEQRGLYWTVTSLESDLVDYQIRVETGATQVSYCLPARSVDEARDTARSLREAIAVATQEASQKHSLKGRSARVNLNGEMGLWRVDFYETDPNTRGGRLVFLIEPESRSVLHAITLP